MVSTRIIVCKVISLESTVKQNQMNQTRDESELTCFFDVKTPHGDVFACRHVAGVHATDVIVGVAVAGEFRSCARAVLPARAHVAPHVLHTAPVEATVVVLVPPVVEERLLRVVRVGDGRLPTFPRDVLATDERHGHEDVHLVEGDVVRQFDVNAVGRVVASQQLRLVVVMH